jgi:APA family basic amino acid/polyamine antiporter
VAFIGFGVAYVNQDNWTPFIPANTGEFGHFGWSGILRGSSVVFFAFIGFDAVSTAAQEAKNPQRDMPIGILGSLVICTLLYVAVAAVLTGLVPFAKLNVPDPIAMGVDVIGKPWLSLLIKFGALAGLTTVILVLLYGQSRIFYTIANDGLLPKVFSKLHPRHGTPYLSQIWIGTIVAIVAGLVPIDILGEMVSIGTLFAFILVCGAVIYLRKSDANTYRPFRVPGVPVIPVLGILFCLVLMRPARRHVAPVGRAACHRPGDLLWLRPAPFGARDQGPLNKPTREAPAALPLKGRTRRPGKASSAGAHK